MLENLNEKYFPRTHPFPGSTIDKVKKWEP